MDRLLAYLTSACDPLTDVVRRMDTERGAVAALVFDPVRTGVWFAALIGPVVRALPPSDPWRALTVRLPDGSQVPSPEVLANDPAAPTLTGAGAVGPSGEQFAGVSALLDLIPRGADDIHDDLTLAGLAENLPLPSAYLLAAASEAHDVAELAVECLRVSSLSPEEGGYTVPDTWMQLVGTAAQTPPRGPRPEGFYVLAAALRWAMVRYRVYTGDMSVSAELPQLALEVEQWLGAIELSPTSPSETGNAMEARLSVDLVWTSPDVLEVQLAATLSRAGDQPPLRGVPIPMDAYDDFKIL